MTSVEEARITRLLRDADADTVARLREVLRQMAQDKAVVPTRSTVATRKEELRRSLQGYDVERLLALQQTMKGFVDEVTGTEITMTEPRQLTREEAKSLMTRYLSSCDVREFLSVTTDLIWEMVRTSIVESLVAEGVEDPEHTNGRLEVPEVGYAFCIEGNGVKDPVLNEELLRESLGERWASVCDVEHVPEQHIEAHDELVFSPQRCIEAIKSDPAIAEKVREALIPGGFKTPRRVVREI